MARQSGRDVSIGVKVDRDRFRSDALNTARSVMGEVGAAFSSAGQALKFPLIFAGIGEIPAATTALANLAGALQQVAQAGLLVPGVIAAATASISTLAIGVNGVGDAWDAITKAADSAGTGQARSASTAARAQRDLNNAYRDARTELADLQLQLRGGEISQDQAILGAKLARRQLQEDLASGQIRDQLDLEQGLLAIRQADQRVAEVSQNNINLQARATEENEKGIAGNDRVVAAQEAVASASESAGASSTAASAAMAKLAPNARKFVQTIVDLKPQFTDLQQTVQDKLFDGLSTEVQTLAARDLPHLKAGMGDVATSWNVIATELARSLGSDSTIAILDRIMDGTADAMTRMGPAIDPLVTAIGTLAAAGTDALPRLVDDFGDLADRFKNFTTVNDQNGNLDRWINEGIDGVEHLGNTLLNVGSIIGAITRAAGGGEGLLGGLERGSEKLAAFLNSVEGQNKLKEWFEEGRREIQEHIIPLLQSLPGFFSGMVQAGQVIANDVVPPLRDISHFLGEHPDLIKNVLIAFAAWKTIDGVTSLIGNLGKISDLLGSGGGAKGRGGKGILGKLGLITVAGVALDNFLDDGGAGDPPAPVGAPPAPGAAPAGQLPVGTPVPFSGTGIPVLPGDAVAKIAVGAAGGAAVAGLPGAALGGIAAIPGASPSTRPQSEQDLITILQALPSLNDENLQPLATGFGISVDQLRAMPRDEFIKRYTEAASKGVPGFAAGGPTPSGRGTGPTGGFLSEVHADEWVLPKHARAAIGDEALWAMTKGRRFDAGGTVDQFGNPIIPGAAPGPVAPNPTQGGVSSAISSLLSGFGGVAGNVAALTNGPASLTGGLAPSTIGNVHGLGGVPGTPNTSTAPAAAAGGGLFGGRMLPGLAGLFQAGGDQNLLSAWGTRTGDWLGKFGAKTLTSFGSTLWQGALGLVGLENSILSPSNAWFQAGSGTAGFFLGQDGPFGGGANATSAGDGTQVSMQSITLGDGTTIQIPAYGTSVTSPGVGPGGAVAQSPVGSHDGLQVNTARGEAIIKQNFPWATNIGGVRADKLKWHPSGLALDVMIPGQGGNNDPTTPEGKAKGDQLYAWLNAHKSELGIDYMLWQEKDHYNHIHVNFAASGFGDASTATPVKKRTGGDIPGYGGGDTVPALLEGGEHVFTKDDVKAMGGQAGVYAFRQALHFAEGGGVPLGALLPRPPIPDARELKPRTPAQPSRPAPAPRVTAPPPPPVSIAPQLGEVPAPEIPTEAPEPAPTGGPAPVAASDGSVPSHTLPAISKGVTSGFAAAGNAVATAVQAAAAAGTFGAAGLGGGGAGSLISGLFAQGGKIANDAIDVASAFLVGNITPGTTENAYGETLVSPRREPQTAPLDGGRTYVFNDAHSDRIVNELRIKDKQDEQATLARYR